MAVAALALVSAAGAAPCPGVARADGFDTARLCAVMQDFGADPANYHSLLVERHGVLAAELYRRGSDRSIYSLMRHTVTFGPGDRHDLRSISKSVTSLLWGIAQAQGKVPLVDTPVATLLPELADLRGGARGKITVAHLLGMSSGLAWNEPGVYNRITDETGLYWRSAPARYVLERPILAAPGTQFQYNGGSTAVIAEILAQRIGMPLDEYARRNLFEPLGITDWEWQRDLHGRPLAFAGLRMRPRDLLKLGRLVLQQGQWDGRQIVPAGWLDESLRPRLATGDGLRYGYQWWAGQVKVGDQSYAWSGALGNGGQRLFVVPKLDLAVVVTAGEYDDSTVGPRLNRLLRSIVTAAVR